MNRSTFYDQLLAGNRSSVGSTVGQVLRTNGDVVIVRFGHTETQCAAWELCLAASKPLLPPTKPSKVTSEPDSESGAKESELLDALRSLLRAADDDDDDDDRLYRFPVLICHECFYMDVPGCGMHRTMCHMLSGGSKAHLVCPGSGCKVCPHDCTDIK